MDHGWVTRSTKDRRRHGWQDVGAQWRAHWSLASTHSGAWELTGEGTKERAECRESVSGLTIAQAVVWHSSVGNEAAVEGGFSSGGV
jgi:hypothetical protein